MKFINSLVGVVAIRVSTDEVMPPTGLVIDDVIKYVGNTYNFSVKPQIPPGILPAALQPFVYQSGVIEMEEKRFPIFHFVVLSGGDIISAQTTEIADKIMDDYVGRLDRELGYRNASATNTRRSYASNIVFEFDRSIEAKIGSLHKIQALLEREIRRPALPFALRRLAFGSGAVTPQGMPVTLEAVENSDFVIERRETEPKVENRYFSSAPTTTSEHIRILEAIERELAS